MGGKPCAYRALCQVENHNSRFGKQKDGLFPDNRRQDRVSDMLPAIIGREVSFSVELFAKIVVI